MIPALLSKSMDTSQSQVVATTKMSTDDAYLDSDRLVVFETAQTVLRFQRVTVGVLRRIKRSCGQIFPAGAWREQQSQVK